MLICSYCPVKDFSCTVTVILNNISPIEKIIFACFYQSKKQNVVYHVLAFWMTNNIFQNNIIDFYFISS